MQGNLLADATVRQIFTIEDVLLSFYEIGEAETIKEMIQKTKTSNEQNVTASVSAAAFNRTLVFENVEQVQAESL